MDKKAVEGKKIREILEGIIDFFAKDKKIVFSNEAQFQFSLAWELKMVLGEKIDISLEHYYKDESLDEKKRYIDIVLFFEDECVPIELKYKTTNKNCKYCGENGNTYNTFNQGAWDVGSYDFIMDVKRIEELIGKYISYEGNDYLVHEGYTIMITNDKRYYEKLDILYVNKFDKDKGAYSHGKNDNKKYYYWQNFSLASASGKKVFKWKNPKEGIDMENSEEIEGCLLHSIGKERANNIVLRNGYQFDWKGYDFVQKNSNEPPIMYVIVPIGKSSME